MTKHSCDCYEQFLLRQERQCQIDAAAQQIEFALESLTADASNPQRIIENARKIQAKAERILEICDPESEVSSQGTHTLKRGV